MPVTEYWVMCEWDTYPKWNLTEDRQQWNCYQTMFSICKVYFGKETYFFLKLSEKQSLLFMRSLSNWSGSSSTEKKCQFSLEATEKSQKWWYGMSPTWPQTWWAQMRVFKLLVLAVWPWKLGEWGIYLSSTSLLQNWRRALIMWMVPSFPGIPQGHLNIDQDNGGQLYCLDYLTQKTSHEYCLWPGEAGS